jgi:chromosome segregation ATPase
LLAQQAAAPAPADSLAPREAVADQRTTEWETLAKALDGKVARMLPCDPRVRSAIEEVSRASEARMAALSDYLRAAAAQTGTEAQRARAAVADEDAGIQAVTTERAEAEQRRAAIDAQLADLKDSDKRRPSLDPAAAKLGEIDGMARARVAQLDQEIARRSSLRASLDGLAASYEARAKAMEAETAALSDESTRWLEYYAARVARAGTECAITNQRPQRKKQ